MHHTTTRELNVRGNQKACSQESDMETRPGDRVNSAVKPHEGHRLMETFDDMKQYVKVVVLLARIRFDQSTCNTHRKGERHGHRRLANRVPHQVQTSNDNLAHERNYGQNAIFQSPQIGCIFTSHLCMLMTQNHNSQSSRYSPTTPRFSSSSSDEATQSKPP